MRFTWQPLASRAAILLATSAAGIVDAQDAVASQWDHDSAEATFVSVAQCEAGQPEGAARRLAAQYWPVPLHQRGEAPTGSFHWLWLRPQPSGYAVLGVAEGPGGSSGSSASGLALVLLPSWNLEPGDCIGWHAKAKATPFGFRLGGVPAKWSRGALPKVGESLAVHGSALRTYGIRLGPAPPELVGKQESPSSGAAKATPRAASATVGTAADVHMEPSVQTCPACPRSSGSSITSTQASHDLVKPLKCTGDWARLHSLLSQLDVQASLAAGAAEFKTETGLSEALSLAQQLFTSSLRAGSIRAQLQSAQQSLLGAASMRKTLPEQSNRKNFCAVGYLVAVAILLDHKPEVFLDQGGAAAASAHLREALNNFEPTALLWYIDDAGWPLQGHLLLSAADRSGVDKLWSHALATHSLGTGQQAGTPDQQKPLLVAFICSHAYLADSLLALKGQALDAAYYGYKIGETYSTTPCNVITCHPGPLSRITERLQHAPAGADTGGQRDVWRSLGSRGDLSELQSELQQAWIEDPRLASSSAIVCGYPLALCLALDAASWRVQPLLLVMAGNPISEYMAPELHPWAFGAIAQLLAERRILTHSRLDALAVFPAVFPGAPTPQFVFFGARYAPLLAGSAPRLDEKKVLVTRLQKMFLKGDIEGLWRLLARAEDEVLQGVATFEQIDREYRFEELLGYRAFVMFPWDWDLTTFREWHVMGFPLYVPCESWMLSLISFAHSFFPDRFIRFRREWWEHGAPRDERTVGDPLSPWLDERLGPVLPQIARLLPLTDYFSSPHVACFSSVADLAQQLVDLDPMVTHRRMLVGRSARWRSSAAQLSGGLRRLLPI